MFTLKSADIHAARTSSAPPPHIMKFSFEGIVNCHPTMFPLPNIGELSCLSQPSNLRGVFPSLNFCHKKIQYPTKPAEADLDRGGQRGKVKPPTGKKKRGEPLD